MACETRGICCLSLCPHVGKLIVHYVHLATKRYTYALAVVGSDGFGKCLAKKEVFMNGY